MTVGCIEYLFCGLTYYLPFYSQSVLGANALDSGLHLLPIVVSSSLAAAMTGLLIQKTGKYLPIMYAAQTMTLLGVGLLISLDVNQDLAVLLGFQVIVGIGVGMNIEPPLIAAQASTTVMDTAVVVATMGFGCSIATAISVVIGGVLFQNQMASSYGQLEDALGSELAPLFNGATATENINRIGELPEAGQVVVREAFFRALRSVWIMYIVATGLSAVSNLFVRAKHLSKDVEDVVLGAKRDKPSAATTTGQSEGHGLVPGSE
ncbi:hypothetical protein B0I35DRAFT_360541 [Stachybotrys elegans]|uniref:Major facilitator superfamily (MFS) profile domain-containing protein n=1 Tax=Stachybotrys elegans TaxID=80388 RepID=A0A8K0WMZ6_9HYPO|nr:hypothetical protein B0I35DRAFT_360541 [Stachybotrys elegans]